jgi:hypothetical protein
MLAVHIIVNQGYFSRIYRQEDVNQLSSRLRCAMISVQHTWRDIRGEALDVDPTGMRQKQGSSKTCSEFPRTRIAMMHVLERIRLPVGGRRLKRSDVYAHRHAQTASAPQSQPKL